ncbi:MAG: phage Gp37/Gp68 family protein [Bacteroidales bacterium]|jgi:protein gp37
MAKTSIAWTEFTWNPTTGCTKISEGCNNCYAEKLSKRLKAMGNPKYKNGFALTMHADILEQPISWKKSKMVFVNSMSDIFHENIDTAYIMKVFEVMNKTPQHTYQVLTKRSERLLKLSQQIRWTPNIWMGVTVENNKHIDRINHLLQTSASTKFLSFEPLIAPIKIESLTGIDWVIVGGESGPNGRLIKKEWIDDIHDICNPDHIPFFFKQWGKSKNNPNKLDPTIDSKHLYHAKGGCQLDGKIYHEYPISLQNY